MRFVLIFSGVALLQKFHWMMYVFGALLIYTAIKMLHENPEEIDPGENSVLRVFRRFMPFSPDFDGNHFFTRLQGRWNATPLFAALLVVEVSDLLFAMDSIPAVLAVSRDPFIVFTSNVFAILGLRALYFLIHGVIGMFRFLRYGLSVVLAFIGAKMLLMDIWKIPIGYSLAVVGGVLALSILLSVVIKPPAEHAS
jgi:tellurite resistance protein TerC